MGQILEAKCRCGYSHHKILFGGVKANYKTVCNVPAINIATGQLEVVNLYDHRREVLSTPTPPKWYMKLFRAKPRMGVPSYENHSETHKFYNNPTLQSDLSRNSHEIRNFDFVMHELGNYCPSCKQFTLNFQPTIFTD